MKLSLISKFTVGLIGPDPLFVHPAFARKLVVFFLVLGIQLIGCGFQEIDDSPLKCNVDFDALASRHFRSGKLKEAVAVVQKHSNDLREAWSIGLLGWSLFNSSPHEAKKYTALSLDIDPRSKGMILQAMRLAESTNDSEYAAQSLRKFFLKNPHLRGSYSANSGFEPELDAIEHGKRQVAQLLVDRPKLKKFLPTESRIYNWMVRRFAGEFIGCRINWTPEKPQEVREERNSYQITGSPHVPSLIWISGNQDAECQFASVVFELLYAEGSYKFVNLDMNGRNTLLSKEEYVRAIVMLEYNAKQKIKAFFASELLGGGLPKTVTVNKWSLTSEFDFEAYFTQIEKAPNGLKDIERGYETYVNNFSSPADF